MRDLFVQRGSVVLLNDTVIDLFLFCIESSVTAATVIAAVAYARSYLVTDVSLFIAAASIVGYLSASTVLKVASAAITTIFICFADSPDDLQVCHILYCT